MSTPLGSLSRSQFEKACRLFIAQQDAHDSNKDWIWQDHPTLPGLGYMMRKVFLLRRSKSAVAEEEYVEDFESFDMMAADDQATVLDLSSPERETLPSTQYVVFSATFQVPTFYFTVHDKSGSPLHLTDLLHTTLFRPHALPPTEQTSFGLNLPSSPFPLLSQGDHPALNTPCWYLHPCETSTAVNELMAEMAVSDWSEEQRLVKWLKTWFMVLGNVVDL